MDGAEKDVWGRIGKWTLSFVNQENQFVGNKAKERISKQVFQENKAR